MTGKQQHTDRTTTTPYNNINNTNTKFQVGDHVFRWRSYLGVPFAYQEHGIVVEVVLREEDNNNNNESNATWNENDYGSSSSSSSSSRSNNKKKKTDSVKQQQQQQLHSIVILNFDQYEEVVVEVVKGTSVQISHENNYNVLEKSSEQISENEATTETTNNTTPTEQHSESPQQKNTSLPTTKTTYTNNYWTITRQVILRKEAEEQWEHVRYSQKQWHKRLAARAGTCVPVDADPVAVILRRVQFLLLATTTTAAKTTKQPPRHEEMQQSTIPKLPRLLYHPHKSNGECAAVWCVTGNYYSHQCAAKMGEIGLHVGSFSLVTGMAGGMAFQIAASMVVPAVLPFIVVYDLYDVAHNVKQGRELDRIKVEWKERTELWNESFQQYMTNMNMDVTNTDSHAIIAPPPPMLW